MSVKREWFLIVIQTTFFVLFWIFTVYSSKYDLAFYDNLLMMYQSGYGDFSLESVSCTMGETLKKNSACGKIERLKLSVYVCFLQCLLFILYVAFGVYTPRADGSTPHNSIIALYGGFNGESFAEVFRVYSMFQDIHVMIFIGFGYLMIFLKKYGYSSIGFNFLLGALCLQWSILCQGFFQLNDDYKIEIGLMSLYRADIATAAVLISMGVVLGRTSYTQLIMMGILQIVAYAVNNNLNELFFKGVDVGGSVLVHCFGAYFGLAVSYILNRNQNTSDNSWQSGINTGSYHSNLLAMIGTIFLWLYWPSFNSIDLENDKAYRAIINTYLALTSSCLTTFIASQLSFKERKFDMVHVQNSTLAGGVAIGASANLMVEPFGAILIGCLSGALSVVGYSIISPFIEKRFKILDTCGVHNLHGMPGLLGGVISVIMAAIANENHYGQTLYQIYPARASPVISINPEYIPLEAGDGRSAPEQAAYQVVMILVTLSIAILSGLLTGFIIKRHFWNKLSPEAFYDDSMFWTMTEEVEQVQYLQDIKVPDKIFHVPNVKAALTRVSSLGKSSED